MSRLNIIIDGQSFEVEVDSRTVLDRELTVLIDGDPVQVQVPAAQAANGMLDWIIVNHRPYRISCEPDQRSIRAQNRIHRLEVRDLEASARRPPSGDGRVKAPIPGLIRRIYVSPGDVVEIGRPLLVLEAMKMENEICAPRTGQVTHVHVVEGQGVAHMEVLVEIT